MNYNLVYKYSAWILFLGFIVGCSAERNNFFSKTYHNTTARFNPYFIANEHLKEVDATVESTHQNNYNRILKIYPDIDSTTIEGLKTQLEDCIKKASKSIDWHKNSNMVNPSYILLGRALFYQGEFEKSIMAYKIVNKNTLKEKEKGNDDVRHEALINLMRTYMHYNEESNAIAVSDFLKKETLNKNNKKHLFLTRAYLYQKRNDLDNVVQNLTEAVPLMKKKEGKAKVYFIIGQIYQSLGFDSEAYNNYTNCIKNNPSYELSFYAKLNRAQVFELSKTNDLKKIRKFYNKLLSDTKNKEFQDKIYFEMGQFEMKQGNLEEAIQNYKSSVASSINNDRQKAYSYLRLGQIYYEELRKFQVAKHYYDSTVAVMPKDEENYEAIEARQQILEDFVTQINTIHLQDSLLQLAQLDSVSLDAYLDNVIEEEEKAKIENEKKAKRSARRSAARSPFGNDNNTFNNDNNNEENATWYFYNTSAIALGRSEFTRNWGQRDLEDDWRRSNKESIITTDNSNDPSDSTADNPAINNVVNKAEQAAARKTALYNTIPLTMESKAAADSLIENAYYRLGKIYNFDLQEKKNAIQTFDTLLIRYPETAYKPEVLYEVYLIYKDLNDNTYLSYKERILNDFPNSIYAKVLRNPNYKEESKIASEKLKAIYQEAYGHYEAGNYQEALMLVRKSKNEFEENDFSDNIRLLEIMLLGKTEDIYKYQFGLSEFSNEYPDSELNDYVKELQNTSVNFIKEANAKKEKKYIEDFDQIHRFVLVYDFEIEGEKEIPVRIEKFISDNYSEDSLIFSNLILTGSKSLIMVNQFNNKESALEFYKNFNGKNSPLQDITSLSFKNFVITKDNFDIFYQTKDLDNYLNFFEEHYNR